MQVAKSQTIILLDLFMFDNSISETELYCYLIRATENL